MSIEWKPHHTIITATVAGAAVGAAGVVVYQDGPAGFTKLFSKTVTPSEESNGNFLNTDTTGKKAIVGAAVGASLGFAVAIIVGNYYKLSDS